MRLSLEASKNGFGGPRLSVFLDRERPPDRVVPITVGDVQSFLIGRKPDSVGARDVAVLQRHGSVRLKTIDSTEVGFTQRIFGSIRKSVNRIGEENISVLSDRKIVGTIETFFRSNGQRESVFRPLRSARIFCDHHVHTIPIGLLRLGLVRCSRVHARSRRRLCIQRVA